MMDHHKLRSAVFEKTGIKIDTTDPIFALVALNEAVLEEMFQRHLSLLQANHGPTEAEIIRPPHRTTMHDNWEQDDPAPGKVQLHSATPAAHAPAQDQAAEDLAATVTMPPPAPASGPAQLNQRVLVFAAALGLASALLVAGVQAVFQPGLSAEQKTQLQQAEKLRKALDKLDPKLKAQLPVEISQLK